MKTLKGLLLIISFMFLVGCEITDQDITFDNSEFRYIGVTTDDYYLYRDDDSELEIKLDEEDTLSASYEKDGDIFIISGKEDSYTIRKNGTIIIACSGEEPTCSGVEDVSFGDDIDLLFAVFEEEGISTTMIIIGILIVLASIALLFVPNRYLSKIKIRNIKLGKLFVSRLVIIIIIIFGITIILLSL